MSFEDRLDALEQRLGEIEAEWSNPDVAVDPDRRIGDEGGFTVIQPNCVPLEASL